MGELTVEQQKAIAIAEAKLRLKQKQPGKVVATTQDGGKVYEMENGSLSFASPGYATTDQDAIARIMEGATPLDEAQRTTDELTVSQHPIAARVQAFNKGAPLIGEWLDEAVGLVSPKAGKAMDQLSDAYERQHPIESTALNVLGGTAYTAPLVAVAAAGRVGDFVARGGNALTRGLRAGVAATPAGVAEGASSFAGRADHGKRGVEAGKGALVGGGLAAALGPMATFIGESAANLARRFKKLDVSTIADALGVSPSAARMIKARLINDDLDAAAEVFARSGDDAMLANAGPATRQALDTQMSMGGEALAIGRKRIAPMAVKAGKKFSAALDDVLGTPGGIRKSMRAIAKKTAAERDRLYNAAWSQPIDYSTGGKGDAILSVLNRVPEGMFGDAVKRANDAIRMDGGPAAKQIMASIGNDGRVVFSELPSLRQLHELKIALNNIVTDGTDKVTGQMSSDAARASKVAGALSDAMKGASKVYKRASKLGGDKIAEQNALKMGKDMLNGSKVSFEDVTDAMKGAPLDVKEAARQGLRQHLDDTMSKAKSAIGAFEDGSFDFDAGQNAVAEAMSAVKSLTTRDAQRKFRAILNPAEVSRLNAEIRRMTDALVLRGSVARGSATAIRQAGQRQDAAEAAPGLLRRTAGELGGPFDAAKELTRAAAGTDAGSIQQALQDNAAEIVDALTRIKGEDAVKALNVMRAAMSGQPIKDAQAALVGRVLAISSGTAGYQSGKALTAPR